MTPLPDYPWQMVGSDLFQIHNDHYLLTVDYFSWYPELTRLSTTTSAAIISALKTSFARFGIPETVRSDNGPQFDSAEFANFASQYGFTHKTSSPRFPQSNGLVELAVKTVKQLLQQSDDHCLALLNFRSTPLPWCDLSHGQRVWITLDVTPVKGTITSSLIAPRSYFVETDTGSVRRNRFHLNPSPDRQVPATPGAEPHKIMTRSQTGTVITPPARSETMELKRGDVTLAAFIEFSLLYGHYYPT